MISASELYVNGYPEEITVIAAYRNFANKLIAVQTLEGLYRPQNPDMFPVDSDEYHRLMAWLRNFRKQTPESEDVQAQIQAFKRIQDSQ